MKKIILASLIGATAFTALMSGNVLAQEFYYRYPIAGASNDSGAGGSTGSGGTETGGTETGGETGGTETCSEGMSYVDGNCVLNTEENQNIWRQFAIDNGIYRFDDDGNNEFERYSGGGLGSEITSIPTVPYPLEFVYGSIILEGAAFSDISGLSNISYIDSLYLSGNNISSFNLNNLNQVEGSLSLYDNQITSLNGLNNLNQVEGSLSLYDNQITSLNGLSNLSSVGEINIRGNNITNLSSLSSLTTANSIHASGNKNMTIINIPSLSGSVETITFANNIIKEVNIPNVNEIVSLSYNYSYNNFKDGVLEKVYLPNLTQGRVILDNNNITDVNLSSVVTASIIYLGDNEIVNLDLSSLKTVTSSLFLENNQLTNLDGISNLESVPNLYIEENPFQNLNGLSNITNGVIHLDLNESVPKLTGSPFCNSVDAVIQESHVEQITKSDLCL
jgi:hypothetical protein